MNSWGVFRSETRWICQDSDFRNEFEASGLDSMDSISARNLGAAITDHRSSWVRQVPIGSHQYFIKTYEYSSWGDRWRGLGRTTLLATSRVHRERRALDWLSKHGFAGPRARAVFERRSLGWLTRAVLVTDLWPGENMATLLPQLTDSDQLDLTIELRRFVERLHKAGFRDRNLDLRNLLARRDDDGWSLAKIDSPRHKITRGDHTDDALAHADWARLRGSLREFDLTL